MDLHHTAAIILWLLLPINHGYGLRQLNSTSADDNEITRVELPYPQSACTIPPLGYSVFKGPGPLARTAIIFIVAQELQG